MTGLGSFFHHLVYKLNSAPIVPTGKWQHPLPPHTTSHPTSHSRVWQSGMTIPHQIDPPMWALSSDRRPEQKWWCGQSAVSVSWVGRYHSPEPLVSMNSLLVDPGWDQGDCGGQSFRWKMSWPMLVHLGIHQRFSEYRGTHHAQKSYQRQSDVS